MQVLTRSAVIEYGFGGRLSSDFPSQILMDITEVCNLACIHCPHEAFSKSEHYAGRFLDPALNEKMVQEAAEHGLGHLQYIRYASNGEPLIHPDGYSMIQLAVDHSQTFVTLTTNGKIMNEMRTQRLLESGVHMIDISIDAFNPETYARVRRKGNLEVTKENVLRLLRWVRESGAKTKVVVSFVEQPLNRAEVIPFESFWRDAGADYVIIRRLHACAGSSPLLSIESHLESGLPSRRPCLYPWERLGINARGDVAFCPMDWVHGSYVGDYRSTTLKEAWQGPFMDSLRKAHLSNDFKKHQFCGQCSDWQSTRWPSEGRSYADLIGDFVSEDSL